MPAIFSDFNTVMAKTNKQTNTLRKYASFFGTSYMCLVDFFSFFFFFLGFTVKKVTFGNIINFPYSIQWFLQNRFKEFSAIIMKCCNKNL